MKRKMYELIVPANQLPIFWMSDDDKILRQISDPIATKEIYKSIERNHWSSKNEWTHAPIAPLTSTRLSFVLVAVEVDDFIPYIKSQIPAMEENYGYVGGNYIVAHRRVGNLMHVGLSIFDAITERLVHWLD